MPPCINFHVLIPGPWHTFRTEPGSLVKIKVPVLFTIRQNIRPITSSIIILMMMMMMMYLLREDGGRGMKSVEQE